MLSCLEQVGLGSWGCARCPGAVLGLGLQYSLHGQHFAVASKPLCRFIQFVSMTNIQIQIQGELPKTGGRVEVGFIQTNSAGAASTQEVLQ